MRSLRITVTYEGRVQGVGFRFTVVDLARNREVTGWVKNESDGTVTLTAEGSETELMALMDAIRRSNVGRFITREVVLRAAPTGSFRGFVVRY